MKIIQQRGSTLIVSLIILVILMLLGVGAMVVSDTGYKLAGNLQFQDSALNNAETAVAEGEKWLSSGTNIQDQRFATTAADEIYGLAENPDPLTMSWDNSTSLAVGGNSAQRYFIDLMSEGNQPLPSGAGIGVRRSSACNKVNTYRVVGQGTSARGAVRFVESYYSVLNC